MPNALSSFLHELIDYAGLFPPAALPLEEAIHQYARYRAGDDAWMMGPFIIPVKQLDALAPHAHLFGQNPPFRFSVLATGGPSAAEFLANLSNDLAAIEAFHARYPGQVSVESLEVRVPPGLADDIRSFLDEAARIASRQPTIQRIFLEVALNDSLYTTLEDLLNGIATHNATATSPRFSLKLRTGGVEAAAFPAPEPVAFAIIACRKAGVSFKATAGLHHPVRLYHESVGTRMYGFFNIFGAALLDFVHHLDPKTVVAILTDEEAKNFQFTADAFSWKDLSATPEDIEQARTLLANSFGSCSFDEPREDLQALGLR